MENFDRWLICGFGNIKNGVLIVMKVIVILVISNNVRGDIIILNMRIVCV